MYKLAILPLSLALLSGCSTITSAEMRVASTLLDAELDSAELVICKLIPISTWQKRYGSTPERAAAWDRMCNAPASVPVPVVPTVVAPVAVASNPKVVP